MTDKKFEALQVNEISDKVFESKIISRSIADLPEGEVTIRVAYSSVNFKDALSAAGNKGVTRAYPHTPGIDAAGVVVSSQVDEFREGDDVVITGYDLGMNTAGGYGQYVRVPANWIVKRPNGLSLRDTMILGTAGLTSAICVEKLLNAGLKQDAGEILVTGATGGVGIISVILLSNLGFNVVASTGKASEISFLEELGASRVLDRNELTESSSKPLLKEQWTGAVDVVGGDTLVNIVKSLKYGSSVAACGLVQSPSFEATVLPFILRGVNLLGIDSVEMPLNAKCKIWEKLAGEWKIEDLNTFCTEITLPELKDNLDLVLAGKSRGRLLLNLES